MKKIAVAICLVLFSCILIFSQSRRPTTTTDGGKTNKRPTATPTPQKTESTESENNTVDEKTEVDDEVLTVSTEIVTIPVKVLDRKGKFIAGLTKEDFKVFEDNAEQEITYFSNEQEPFTVALVLDMSYSAKFKIEEIQSAAIAFVAQLSPKDRVMIVSFDEEVHVLTQPTSDRNRLVSAIKSTKIASGTSVYDAVDLVIDQHLRKIGGRKAIVLFTDGVDTTSRRANDLSNKTAALELDALCYVVQYDTYSEVQALKDKPIITQQPTQIPGKTTNPFPFPVPTVGTPSSQGTTREDYQKADEYLNELALRTGGEVFKASDIGNISLAFAKVAAQLREYYSIGFYPKEESKDGKRHKIKVRVNRENVAVKARDSYTAKKSKK
ncbi:hypothetical protein BH10ACI1_BH10ACI1_13670 [soil metagenome]